MVNAIEVKDLTKQFGNSKVALGGISFSVGKGEIFGFLGPNGAGKSTTLKILTTILKPTQGSVIIEGIDVAKNPLDARMQFGYVSQDTAVDDKLTGQENLYLQGRYYHLSKKEIKKKSDHVLNLLNLTTFADQLVSTYSGGMRKKLDIACSLMNSPKLLFLDEPTLGLDIQSRKEIWEYINILNQEFKTTIFLTTHYMEEADAICDDIAIIDEGKIITQDSPRNLKANLGSEIIELTIEKNSTEKYEMIAKLLSQTDFVKKTSNKENKFIIVTNNAGDKTSKIFELVKRVKVKIINISLKKVSLDDVFLSYTGKKLKSTNSNPRMYGKFRMGGF